MCKTSLKFSVHASHGRGSILLWRRCNWPTLCRRISGFVNDVIFVYNDQKWATIKSIWSIDLPESSAGPGSSLASRVVLF